jgi:hypothetical protein
MDSNIHAGLSWKLLKILERCSGESISLSTIFSELSSEAYFIFLLFIVLPFLFPIPLPGLSTPFGVIVVIAGARIAMAKPIWLPKKWLNRPFKTEFVRKFLEKSITVSRKIEFLIKPRAKFLSSSDFFRVVNGIAILLVGFLLLLPMPPGLNFPPALAIVAISVGAVEEDGFLVGLGYLLVLINMALFTALAMLGIEGIEGIIYKII